MNKYVKIFHISYKYIYNVVFDFQISNKNCQRACVSSPDLRLFAFCDFLSLRILSIKWGMIC